MPKRPGRPSGGTLDVDDCVLGICKDPDATHVENIVFTSAAPGLYTYWAYNYERRVDTQVTIEAFFGDLPEMHVEIVPGPINGEGVRRTITYQRARCPSARDLSRVRAGALRRHPAARGRATRR